MTTHISENDNLDWVENFFNYFFIFASCMFCYFFLLRVVILWVCGLVEKLRWKSIFWAIELYHEQLKNCKCCPSLRKPGSFFWIIRCRQKIWIMIQIKPCMLGYSKSSTPKTHNEWCERMTSRKKIKFNWTPNGKSKWKPDIPYKLSWIIFRAFWQEFLPCEKKFSRIRGNFKQLLASIWFPKELKLFRESGSVWYVVLI